MFLPHQINLSSLRYYLCLKQNPWEIYFSEWPLLHHFFVALLITMEGYFGLHRYLIGSHFTLHDWLPKCQYKFWQFFLCPSYHLWFTITFQSHSSRYALYQTNELFLAPHSRKPHELSRIRFHSSWKPIINTFMMIEAFMTHKRNQKNNDQIVMETEITFHGY